MKKGQGRLAKQHLLPEVSCNPGQRAALARATSNPVVGFKRNELAMAIALATGTIAATTLLPVQSAEAAEFICPTAEADIGVIDTLSIVSGDDTLSGSTGITQCQVLNGPTPQGQADGRLIITGRLSNSIDLLTGGSLGPAGSINIFGTLTNLGTLTNNYNAAPGQGEINVRPGGTLTNDSTLTNNSTLNNDGSLYNDGLLTNTGTLNNDGSLRNRGALNNIGTLNNTGTLDTFGTLINDGTLNNSDNGAMYVSSLTNNGTLTNNSFLWVFEGQLSNHGSLTNSGAIGFGYGFFSNSTSGTVTNNGAMSLTISGFSNSGTFTNNGELYISPYFGGTNNGSLTNSGTLTLRGNIFEGLNGIGTLNQIGGSFLADGSSVTQSEINITAGSLSGTGTIESTSQALLIGDNATLAPGNSVGRMDVIGDLDLDGTLALEIESPGSTDSLAVTGLVDLSGFTDILDIDLLGGYAPQLGDSWDLFFADTISGEFDNLLLPDLGDGLRWQTEYLLDEIGPTDVFRLRVSQVPLPAAAWFFGSALGLLGWAGRNRQRAPT